MFREKNPGKKVNGAKLARSYRWHGERAFTSRGRGRGGGGRRRGWGVLVLGNRDSGFPLRVQFEVARLDHFCSNSVRWGRGGGTPLPVPFTPAAPRLSQRFSPLCAVFVQNVTHCCETFLDFLSSRHLRNLTFHPLFSRPAPCSSGLPPTPTPRPAPPLHNACAFSICCINVTKNAAYTVISRYSGQLRYVVLCPQ